MQQTKKKRILNNQRGQSLIEYVILVALVGAATIGLVRTLQEQVKVNLTNVIYTLQSQSRREKAAHISEEESRKSDFTDFMNGAANGHR